MAIPEFQEFMLPTLKIMSDKIMRKNREIYDLVAENINLTNEDKAEMLPSGTQPRYANRADWALHYLHRAGLIDVPKRGFSIITDEGLKVLKENLTRIDRKYLTRFPKFIEYVSRGPEVKDNTKISSEKNFEQTTPEEEIDHVNKKLNQALSDELLGVIKSVKPSFFEQLVIDLLLKMGYGGSKAEAGKAVGKSGDGGIDGIINEDRLGLDKVYVQAKRWEATVGRPQIQAFVGSLAGHHSNKGIFITTSEFSKEAREYIEKINSQISLIDGSKLVDLMIEHNLGVNVAQTYEIKKIDRDYFPEDI